MKRYHTATIARLLERYMAGTTTLSEERQLERYFLTATDIPREWAVYQTMFAQYAQMAVPHARHTVRPVLRWVAAASVFMLCALAVWLWLPQSTTPADNRPVMTAHHTVRSAVTPISAHAPSAHSESTVTQTGAIATPSPTLARGTHGLSVQASATPQPLLPTPFQSEDAPARLSAKPIVPIPPMVRLQILASEGYAPMIDDLARQEAAEAHARDLQLLTALVASGEVSAIDVLADLAAGVSPADLFIENI